MKFHEKCDNQGPNLSIFELDEEIIIGIYTPLNWDTNSDWKDDLDTFIFNLNKKKKHKKISTILSIYCNKEFGPFAGCIGCNSGEEILNVYYRNTNIYQNKYEKDYEILPSGKEEKLYKINELEVYKIIIAC